MAQSTPKRRAPTSECRQSPTVEPQSPALSRQSTSLRSQAPGLRRQAPAARRQSAMFRRQATPFCSQATSSCSAPTHSWCDVTHSRSDSTTSRPTQTFMPVHCYALSSSLYDSISHCGISSCVETADEKLHHDLRKTKPRGIRTLTDTATGMNGTAFLSGPRAPVPPCERAKAPYCPSPFPFLRR